MKTCCTCKEALPEERKCARCRGCQSAYDKARVITYPPACSKCGAEKPSGRKHRWCAGCQNTSRNAWTRPTCLDCNSPDVMERGSRCRHCQTVWNKQTYDPVARKAYMDRYYAQNKDYFLENARRRKARRKGAKVVKKVNIKGVIARCGDRCQFCGVDTSAGGRTIDHIFPLKRGGTHEESNLQVLCSTCNRAKSTMTMEEFVAAEREVRRNSPVSTTDTRAGALQSAPVTGAVP